MKKFFTIMMAVFLLTFGEVKNVANAENLFVTVNLHNGISIQVPRNWQALDQSSRITLEASTASRLQLPADANMSFAANLYNQDNVTIGITNVNIYPDMDFYQKDVLELDDYGLNEFDEAINQSISDGLKRSGLMVTHWYGTRKVKIRNKVFLVSSYRRTSAVNKESFFKVRMVRLLDGKNSLTLTLSFEEKTAFLLEPIIEKMQNSIIIP